MFELSGIIPDLLKNFWRLLPFRFVIVYEYEQGVFFRAGNAIQLCDSHSGIPFPYYSSTFPWIHFQRSGLFFHWAWIESIPTITTVLQVMETQIQTITTKDNKEASISFSISYEIFDAVKYWTKVQEFDHSLENFIQGELGDCVTKSTYDEIRNQLSVIQQQVQSKVDQWGVRIDAVRIINLTQAKPIRLLGVTTLTTG